MQAWFKNHEVAFFFDLSKAFDSIDHDNLLAKLETLGFASSAKNIIQKNHKFS